MRFIKLPSISSLWDGIIKTAKRFPLPLCCAVITFCLAAYMIELNYTEQRKHEDLYKIMMCCWLGLNLFLSIIFYSESKGISYLKSILLQVAAAGLLTLYYFSLPEIKDFDLVDIARYVLFIIGMHLLVSFSPFTVKGHINGFWQFNKTLFLRFLTSALYTGVLYLGLMIALFAIDHLFSVNVDWKRYMDLWFFLSIIFNTWFFLSGIPERLQDLENSDSYPKGLKIFTQFVLLPLVTVYLLILYAYTIKILIRMQIPSGWVANLVIGFSTAGILSLLLIYPIRNLEGNKWIRNFSRWFYLALYPLIILLFVAIYKRLNQYGMTENRYFVLLIAFWLGAIATYFLLSKKENIKVIPISLFLIAILSSFGPWGAFRVSESSQVKRLETYLEKNKVFVNGKIKGSQSEIPKEDYDEIRSIVRYLDDTHGFRSIKPWFTQNLDSAFIPADSGTYVNKTEEVLKLMGIDKEHKNAINSFGYYAAGSGSYDIKGYDYYTLIDDDDDHQIMLSNGDSIDHKFLSSINTYIFKNQGKIIMAVPLTGFVKTLKAFNDAKKKKGDENEDVSNEEMIYESENRSLQVKFIFSNFSGELDSGKLRINNMNGSLLLKIK